MSQPLDPEARFLELAARPGMERLREECPDAWPWERGCKGGIVIGYRQFQDMPCATCQGRGWLPLPEAERLGALVEVVHFVEFRFINGQWGAKLIGVIDPQLKISLDCRRVGSTHCAALTEAILASLEVAKTGVQRLDAGDYTTLDKLAREGEE